MYDRLPFRRRSSSVSVGAPLLRGVVAAGAAAVVAGAIWWRRHPSACPYGQRFWVQSPHPIITRSRLRAFLAPQPGERILEVGPGTGYYTLDTASALTEGRLDIFDLQQKMLDHTTQLAQRRGLQNITATRGDACSLPYADNTFDAAYLVAVLGEIPDQQAALNELARVLRPGGRLVVGELFGDPHWVRPGQLRARSESAGLSWNGRSGTALAYFARMQPVKGVNP